jgi:transcriptional regulator with XRE-family HTH domain
MTQLRDYLKDSRKTPSALAKELGVQPSTITRIVRGERQPSARLARRIAQVTGLALPVLRPDVYGPMPDSLPDYRPDTPSAEPAA